MLCETLILATVDDELEDLTPLAVLPVPPVAAANIRFRSSKIASRAGTGDAEGDAALAFEGSPPLCRAEAVTA